MWWMMKAGVVVRLNVMHRGVLLLSGGLSGEASARGGR